MNRYFPKEVLIEKGLNYSPLVNNVLKALLPKIPVTWLSSPQRAVEKFLYLPDPLAAGKRRLLIMRNRGHFFVPCPGTPRYLCCLYKILNFATNCNMECSYCILQSYLSNPLMVLFGNTDEMFQELTDVFSRNRDKVMRLGTGEFTDSLSLEHLTEFTRLILPLITRWPYVFLELKTKTNNIEPLLGLEHNRQVIVSWSLNTPRIVEQEEWGTAKLEERLEAARRCQEHGYPVGFHFDPIIYHPGWEQDYSYVIKELFSHIDPEDTVWISLGTLRFPPMLKPIIKRRFPDTYLLYHEFIKGIDGKLRYFRPLRIEIYQHFVEQIRNFAPQVLIYLCMESEAVWKKTVGFSPKDNHDFCELLNDACLRVCLKKGQMVKP